MTMTPQQCIAARVLTKVDRALLSEKSFVSLDVLIAFEEDRGFSEASEIASLQRALEKLGIEFIPEEGACGAGVRLKFSKAESAAISTWETEGGDAAEDNLP